MKAWIETLAQLQLYVKEHHTTGLVWNKSGGNAVDVAKGDLSFNAKVMEIIHRNSFLFIKSDLLKFLMKIINITI